MSILRGIASFTGIVLGNKHSQTVNSTKQCISGVSGHVNDDSREKGVTARRLQYAIYHEDPRRLHAFK